MLAVGGVGGVGRLGLTGGRLRPSLLAQVQALFSVPGSQGVLYDASVLSSLFQDSAGITPVTASGQSVGRQNDLSGLGNHSTQATAGNRPLYQVTDGSAHLTADGTDDWLATSAFAWGSDEVEIIAAMRKNSDALVSSYVGLSNNPPGNAGTFELLAPHVNSQPTYRWQSRGTVSSPTIASGFAAPVLNVVGCRAKISTDVATISINNSDVGTTNGDQGAGNYGTYQLFRFGRGGSFQPFNGRDYRFFAINRLLTTAERALVRQWAAQGAGITL